MSTPQTQEENVVVGEHIEHVRHLSEEEVVVGKNPSLTQEERAARARFGEKRNRAGVESPVEPPARFRPPFTSEELAREIHRIRATERWPIRQVKPFAALGVATPANIPRRVLAMKKIGPRGYVAFGTLEPRNLSRVRLRNGQVETFASIDEMIGAGWIVD